MAVLRGMVEDCKAAKRWQKSIKPVVDVLVTFSRDDNARLNKRQQRQLLQGCPGLPECPLQG